MSLVKIENISVRFGSVKALDNISLTIEHPAVLAVLGENGAGKSTLLKCIASLCKPDSGTIELDAKTRIGFLSHETFLYDDLSVEANLRFWAGLSGLTDPNPRIAELLTKAALTSKSSDKVADLSAGMKKRASICRAVLAEPDILLLDEPYSNLDQQGGEFLRDLINEYKNSDRTVIVATHQNRTILGICTAAAVLHAGRLTLYKSKGLTDTETFQKQLFPQENKPAYL